MIGQAPEKVQPALVRFLDDAESGLTAFARDTFSELYEQLKDLDSRIERVTRRIERVYRTHPICRKLAAVSGIGPLTATALLATIGRPQAFQNGRHLAAWLGLVPRQYSSGGKEIFGGISKRGSRYVRTLLIHGARAVVQRAARRTDTQGQCGRKFAGIRSPFRPMSQDRVPSVSNRRSVGPTFTNDAAAVTPLETALNQEDFP